MTTLVLLLIGAGLFTLIPAWSERGNVERRRRVTIIPYAVFGLYVSRKYGFLDGAAVMFGVLLISCALVIAQSLWAGRGLSGDAAGGADYQDLVGPGK